MNNVGMWSRMALAAGTWVAMSAQAAPVVLTLPTPGSIVDGIVAHQVFDQGLVYSSRLLDQWQTAGLLPGNQNYLFSTGTGGIPVLVYTGANGATNDSPFANPLSACGGGNCTQFDGTWGLSSQVGTLGALRTALAGANMMFYFDHNEQEGRNATPNLRVSGQFQVYDANNQLKASFAIDANPNSSYDPAAYITSCSTAVVGGGGLTDGICNFGSAPTSASYVLDSNSGSGKPDFFVLFPQFNLYSNAYSDTDKIVVTMSLRDLDPGFDELGIAGYRFATTTTVPEPGALALAGMGLLAACLVRRRQRGQ